MLSIIQYGQTASVIISASIILLSITLCCPGAMKTQQCNNCCQRHRDCGQWNRHFCVYCVTMLMCVYSKLNVHQSWLLNLLVLDSHLETSLHTLPIVPIWQRHLCPNETNAGYVCRANMRTRHPMCIGIDSMSCKRHC